MSHETTPIFGQHAVGQKSRDLYNSFSRVFAATGRYPEMYTWSPSVISQARDLNPGIVAIDGQEYDPRFGSTLTGFRPSKWVGFPGNPYDISPGRRLLVLDGDVPTDYLIVYKQNRPLYNTLFESANRGRINANQYRNVYEARSIVNQGVINYWEVKPDQDIEDVNLAVPRSEKDIVGYKWMAETFGLGFLFPVLGSAYFWNRFLREEPISRRAFITYLATSFVFVMNKGRLWATMFPPEDDVLYKSYALPATTLVSRLDSLPEKIKRLEERNALVDLKLDEADMIVGDDFLIEDPKVAIFGTAHKYGRDIWNDPSLSREVVRSMAIGIFGEVDLLLEEMPSTDIARLKPVIAEELATLMGGSVIWHRGSRPKVLDRKAVEESIRIYKKYTSPTVSKVITEAAVEAGYIN